MELRLPAVNAYALAKRLLGPPLHLGFPVRVEGLAHVPTYGPVVLAPNHRSIVDSILLANVVPRPITFVAKVEHFDDWRSGWAMRLTNQIPVRRDSAMAAGRALAAAGRVLAHGGIIGIFPEGTRSRDGLLQPGNDGPAWLALRHHVPIVPVGLIGTETVHAPGELWPHPFRSVRMRFGSPIVATAGERRADERRAREMLTERVMTEIAALCGQERADALVPAASETLAPAS